MKKNLKKNIIYPETFLVYSESSIIYKKIHQDHVDSRVFFTFQDTNFLRVDLCRLCEKLKVLALLFDCIMFKYSNSYSNYQNKQVEAKLTLTQLPFLDCARSKMVHFVARLNFGGLIL